MPLKRRPSSILGPLVRHDRDYPPPVPNKPSAQLHFPRNRTQSLRSELDDEVYIFTNLSNATINLPVAATYNTNMTNSTDIEVPSYISSRSANSLISFSRPTRIQAITLHYLNKILDELLLRILTSAKSLATDRIKTDGILKVLGGQTGSGSGAGAVLAKNAVLEAELELRNYLDGQRKEGGKVPLGLSATSRWDGTATFPVQKAYEALRIRCQFYSTLGDLEDPSPLAPQDQNIMSEDGRPIATITPGVAIYVTALLEFVAEYILQNVGRVIERDNSDEAGVGELRKAMEEDEGTVYWWKQMSTREEVVAKEQEELAKGAKGRVGKPWMVPEASEWGEAAGRKKFQRQSLVTASTSNSSSHMARQGMANSVSASFLEHRGSPSAMSFNGHESRDSSVQANQRIASPLLHSSAFNTDLTSMSSSASTDTQLLTRKASTDKGWFGKKRGSVRASSDMKNGPTNTAASAIPFKGTITASDNQMSEAMNSSDDFDSLMMSNQTMKVSLTPNRLRSIEVAKQKVEEDDVDEKRNSSRKRPGTLSPLLQRDIEQATRSSLPSPSISARSRISTLQEEVSNGASPDSLPSSSKLGTVSGSRSTKKAAPPSAYRAVTHGEFAVLDDAEVDSARKRSHKNLSNRFGADLINGEPKIPQRNIPRDERRQDNVVKEMVEMFNSTPILNGGTTTVNTGRESRMSQSAMSVTSTDNGSTSRKSAINSAGGKVRSLFGKRTPSNSVSKDPAQKSPQYGMAKIQIPSRGVEDRYPQLPGKDGARSMSGTAGLAITGAGNGSVLDALTQGLLDGHERAIKSSSEMTQVEESLQNKDTSGDFISEPGIMEGLALSNGTHDHSNSGTTKIANSPGGVGLYQDVRSSSSASDLSLVYQQTGRGGPDRKVPWGYNRQPSSNGRRLSGTSVPTGIVRVGSGASSSLDHSSTLENAPPSAWSLGQGHALGGSSLEGRNTTPSPLITNGSPRSPTPSYHRPSDTARTLAQLNQKMKGASSAEECRFLLTQALAVAAAAVRNDCDQPTSASLIRASSAMSYSMPMQREDNESSFGDVVIDRHGEIPDEEESYDKGVHSQMQAETKAASALESIGEATTASRTGTLLHHDVNIAKHQVAAPVKYRNLMLPMAVGYNSNDDIDTPSHKQQGYLVAWLLEGEEEFQVDVAHTDARKKEESTVSSGQSVPIVKEMHSFSSANDDQQKSQSFNVSKLQKRQSNVDSIASIYRDAASELSR